MPSPAPVLVTRVLPSCGIRCGRCQLRVEADGAQATTWMGSPTFTSLKYHAALSGLRLMHP